MKSIQHSLQDLQKSSDGLKLAEILLNTERSSNCQFFGALTYTVVLNSSDHLTNQDVDQFVEVQGDHILRLAHDLSPNLFIIRKLLSNVSLAFIKYSNYFDCPMKWLLRRIASSVDEVAVNSAEQVESLSTLSREHLSILIYFSSIIVEDICKLECPNRIHELVVSGQTFGITESIFRLLSGNIPNGLEIIGLDCMNSWVTYTSLAEDTSIVRYPNFEVEGTNSTHSVLLLFLFRNFNVNFDTDIINKAILVATEIIEINPRLLNHESRDYLKLRMFGQDEFGPMYIRNLIDEGFQEELLSLVNLFIAILRNDILHLAKTVNTDETRHILFMLVELTNAPGIPVEDEQISDLTLEFWEELANVFIDDEDTFDAIFSNRLKEEKDHFISTRNSIFEEICFIYWNKIHIPSDPGIFNSIRSEFLHYRSNVSDFFIVIYSLLKEPFYEKLTDNVCKEITNRNLIDLESSLFLLYKVTDDILYLESQSSVLLKYIQRIFNSGLLLFISNSSYENYYLYSTAINFLSSVQFFFKHETGTGSLSEVFDLLFRVLLHDSKGSLSLHCSKTILKICQECREKLVDFLPNLEQLLVEMLRNKDLDNMIRQRMVNSYTSIGRCVRHEEKFGEIVKNELVEINDRVKYTLPILLASVEDDIFDYLLSLLTCIVEMGKASQIPNEVDEFFTPDQQQITTSYWREDPLQVQSLIFSIIKQFSFSSEKFDSLVTEKCCLILKSGLGESIPGPFVFPLPTILEYVVMKMENCTEPTSPSSPSSIPFLYSLIESIVITSSSSQELSAELMTSLLISIFDAHFQFLQSDPDLIQCSISLFATILEKKPSLIVHSPNFSNSIIPFALNGLRAKEPFVLKVALKFWLTLLTLKKGNMQDQTTVKNLMVESTIGQVFVYSLIKSFINSTRSNLDSYYQVFRNLISKFPTQFKAWTTVSFEKLQLEMEGKAIEKSVSDKFISKLVLSRGMRSANEVLKSFWLESNGLIEFNSRSY